MKTRKVVFFAFLSLIFSCLPVFGEEEKTGNWQCDCQLLEQAIGVGKRVNIAVWPSDWITKETSLEQKTKMYKLWILGANKAYVGEIMPVIYELMWWYNQKIWTEKNNSVRGKIFFEKVNVLLDIFQTLDQQINDWLVKGSPQEHPGSFFEELIEKLSDRDCFQYHKKEINQLKRLLGTLEKKKLSLSKDDYEVLYKNFSGKLRYYQGGE